MIIARNDETQPAKGWYMELFHPALPAIGFANECIQEKHYHRELHEVYLIVRGSSTIIINDTGITLNAGDVIVVEPGEVHTFMDNTPDYFHYVLHCPRVRNDKVLVP